MNTVDREQRIFRFERTVSASPEAVFDAWTRPEELTAWWDPDGHRLSACTVDLRPGGAFRFVNVGHAPPFEGTYLTVERPSLLVFDAMGARGTVSIARHGAATRLVVEIRSPSPEHFALFVQLRVDAGTARTLDNLVAHLAP